MRSSCLWYLVLFFMIMTMSLIQQSHGVGSPPQHNNKAYSVTQGANAVLERAKQLAAGIGNMEIHPLHVALSLFDESQKGGGLGDEVATKAGTTSNALRKTIKALIRKNLPTQQPPPAQIDASRSLQVGKEKGGYIEPASDKKV